VQAVYRVLCTHCSYNVMWIALKIVFLVLSILCCHIVTILVLLQT